MKLGIISPYPPLKGGISKETELLYSILKNKYKIQIFSYKKLYPNFIYPDSSQYDYSNTKSNNSNVSFCIDSVNPISWNRTVNRILKFNCNNVIIRYWSPFFIPLYLYLIKKIKHSNNNAKFYSICDNIAPHERFPFSRFLIKRFFKKIDGFLVMSSESEKLLSKLVINKKIVKSFLPLKKIYDNSMLQSSALEELKIIKPKLLLLSFGFVRPYKGLELMLESLANLKNFDIKLLIAGKCYIDKKKYIKLIKKYSLQEKVIWHDEYIPDSKVHLYFTASDVVMLTHSKISQSGIIPLAYNYNKLIIASNLNSFKENIQDTETGYLYDNNCSSSLTRKIKYVYEKHNFKSSELSIANYKKRYSEGKILDDFSLLFKP